MINTTLTNFCERFTNTLSEVRDNPIPAYGQTSLYNLASRTLHRHPLTSINRPASPHLRYPRSTNSDQYLWILRGGAQTSTRDAIPLPQVQRGRENPGAWWLAAQIPKYPTDTRLSSQPESPAVTSLTPTQDHGHGRVRKIYSWTTTVLSFHWHQYECITQSSLCMRSVHSKQHCP